MAVALAPDQAVFDNISLVRIGARFMDDRQECIRWCRQWIFGGYDPATKEGFLLPVPRRNAATLMPLIIQWVRPGTEIWSDMWGAYNGIAAPGFQHDVVNHQYNFVDLILGLQQTMSRQCGSGLKQNLNQCLAQQIVT